MNPPDDLKLPLFAYGLFKPEQLGHYRLKSALKSATQGTIEGQLLERDGAPVLVEDRGGHVSGYALAFERGKAEATYEEIGDVEPRKHYRWVTRTISVESGESQKANVLLGRNPGRGLTELETNDWDGSDDPLFTDALDVVADEISSENPFDWQNKKPFFRLHMAYLLLWSSIERYISLRYGLRGRPDRGRSISEKYRLMAGEPSFYEGLHSLDFPEHRKKRLYRVGEPDDHDTLDPSDPVSSIHYYYRVRSNLSHRGKSAYTDLEVLSNSLEELYTIFRNYVLPAAFE